MATICHLSCVHTGLDIRIYRKQCVALARAGHTVHLVIAATPDEVREAAAAGITVHCLPSPARMGRWQRMLWLAWRCYRLAAAQNAALYHFHDPELLPYGVLLRRRGAAVIYDAHEDVYADIQSKPWIAPWLRRAAGTMARRVERQAARRLSAVVAATPHIATALAPWAARVAVVHNFPLTAELAPAARATAEFSGFAESAESAESAKNGEDDESGESGENADYGDKAGNAGSDDAICYVGAISASRGVGQLIDALAIARVRLLLAGRYESPALRALWQARPGWQHVEECGYLDRAGVAAVMARSFCGLVTLLPEPNYVNALPIKLFEYMAAGLPVVASDFPLWRAIVEEAGCGICVDPRDPAAIAAAITRLRCDPALARAMGARGRAAVARRYRWEGEAETLTALYDALLPAQ